jgi:hypothetical protein
MKKLITLLLATGVFFSVQAQTSKDEARRIILGQEKGNNNNSTSRNGRDVVLGGGNETTYPNSYPNNYPSGSQSEIDRLNREYDAKIWSIRNNNTLSSEEKARMIRQLEQDRDRRIRQINQNKDYGYGKKGKKYDDDNDHGKGYGKSNNGKHLGWEKGKGNPHKNGGKLGKG